MKKLAAIVLALALLIVPMSISASAAGAINEYEQAVLDSLDENVKVNDITFHLPDEYINQAENFLKTIDMTKEQSEEILAKIADGKEIVVASDITSTSDLKVLPTADKQKILDLGKAAAAAVDAVLTYDGENVKVTYDDTVIFEDAPIIKVTGAETDYTAVVISVACVIAVLAAAFAVAQKKGLFVK